MMRLALVLLALALAGCKPVASPGFDRLPPEPAPDANACGADAMQDLVGKDKSVFAAMTFPVGTRIIEPGTAITEDFSASRLNFDLDAKGRITRVWCG
jgi:Peptidase inhibitor I78 family